jgi:hypothetical protein
MKKMKKQFLIFAPDDHYGYPKAEFSSKFTLPLDYDTLKSMYDSADCSATSMADEEGESLFDDYGNFDIYTKVYIFFNEVNESEISDLLEETFLNIDEGMGIDIDFNKHFLRALADHTTESFLCIDFENENSVTIDGNNLDKIGSNHDDFLIELYLEFMENNNFEKKSRMFSKLRKIGEFEKKLRSKISEEEYNKLLIGSKGYNIFDRFS